MGIFWKAVWLLHASFVAFPILLLMKCTHINIAVFVMPISMYGLLILVIWKDFKASLQ